MLEKKVSTKVHVSFLSQVELQCEWEGFASGVPQLRPHMWQHPPLRSHRDTKSWRELWRRGGSSLFIFDLKLTSMLMMFDFELIDVQQFSVRTEASPAAVDLHCDHCCCCDVCRRWGQHLTPQIVFPNTSIKITAFPGLNYDLVRLCPLLFTRSCSPPADEKGVGRKH